jgi:hypothetical protein
MDDGCSPFTFGLGGRVFFANFEKMEIERDDGPNIDLIDDLQAPDNAVFWELFASFRLPPKIAFTYTAAFQQKLDVEGGVLPNFLTVGDVTYAPGSFVSGEVSAAGHRFEGVYYATVGCKYRAGPLVAVELFPGEIELTNDQGVSVDESETPVLISLGGEVEYGVSDGNFVKLKAAYNFGEDLRGLYVEGEGRVFPGTGVAKSRPFLGAGYRYRSLRGEVRDNQDLESITHGPFLALGVLF